MRNLLAMRVAYFIPAIRFYEDIGTPVERELERANLPTDIVQKPDAYVCARFVADFRNNCRKIEKIDDLGWHIYRSNRPRMLNPRFRQLGSRATTVLDRLNDLVKTVPIESSFARCGIAETIRGFTFKFNAPPAIDIDDDPAVWEWNRLMQIIAIVQSGAGESWRPRVIGFVSKFKPCDEALEYFKHARINFGQPWTSVEIPFEAATSSIATKPVKASFAEAQTNGLQTDDQSNLSNLKLLLREYLAEDGLPNLSLAAEVSGMSARSFQRLMKDQGTSFSELLRQIRYDLAKSLLADSDLKIIEIAQSAGYESPTNFSRAFRQTSGLSPRDYRSAFVNGRVALK